MPGFETPSRALPKHLGPKGGLQFSSGLEWREPRSLELCTIKQVGG